jgi:cell division protein FtsQ
MASDDQPGGGPNAAGQEARAPVGGVVVDPRMRSRRIGVRRAAGRRRLKRVTILLGMLVVASGAVVASQSSMLDVDRLVVSGARRTGADDVLRVSRVEQGDPMVGVDPAEVARRVEALPWVDEATVVRSWPATVRIEVTERSVAAVVQVTDERVALVDAHGRVLAIEPRPPDTLYETDEPLLVTGVEGRVAEGEMLGSEARPALRLAVAVGERMPGVVASVSTELDAVLVGGGAIRFGSPAQLDVKVVAAKAVLDDVDTGCLDVLDVRVPGSPALTRNQRCS